LPVAHTLPRNGKKQGAEFSFSSIQELSSQREENKASLVKSSQFSISGFSEKPETAYRGG
jgi:hypothetical protein